jgi:signal transduction histidine kinase
MPPETLPPRPVSVLIVDDEPANLLALEAALADPGVALVRAATGEEALRRVLAEDFAVVLLDINLPGIDGFEAARLIRSRPKSRHTPIIFVTGHDPTAFPVEGAYALGAVDYLYKPVVPAVLRAKVRVFIDLAAAAAALRAEVADRQRAEAAARAAAEELGRSNAELERFAYIASHDLQEPLRKIRSFGDRLRTRNRDALGEAGRADLDRMLSSAERMARLIDDLLAYSRVGAQRRPFERVDLTELARQTAADLEAQAQRTGGRVEIGPLFAVDGDPTQLRQLFQNLIGNGLKYHRPDVPPVGRVVAGTGEVTVSDNGIGFEEKHRDRMFELFERLHPKDHYEGTGLGLAICRKVAERHGGSIAARGTPGQGSVFTVSLPLRPAPGAARPEGGRGGDAGTAPGG